MHAAGPVPRAEQVTLAHCVTAQRVSSGPALLSCHSPAFFCLLLLLRHHIQPAEHSISTFAIQETSSSEA